MQIANPAIFLYLQEAMSRDLFSCFHPEPENPNFSLNVCLSFISKRTILSLDNLVIKSISLYLVASPFLSPQNL